MIKFLNNHACISNYGSENFPAFCVMGWKVDENGNCCDIQKFGYQTAFTAKSIDECKVWCDMNGIKVLSNQEIYNERIQCTLTHFH